MFRGVVYTIRLSALELLSFFPLTENHVNTQASETVAWRDIYLLHWDRGVLPSSRVTWLAYYQT
jgi:hypothetical protein